MVTYLILTGVVILFFAVGLTGIALPFLPGLPLIWLGTVIFAIFTGFRTISFLTLAFFTFLMLFSVTFDYLAYIYGAKKFGAGKWGIVGAVLGMMIGVIVGGLPGLMFGPFLGAFLGELLSGKSHWQAFRAGLGTMVGFLSGIMIKFTIGLIIIGIFIWKAF